MIEKPKAMSQRLPGLLVPDEMMAQLSEISEKEGVTLSETVRQGLAFFLSRYFSQAKVSDNQAKDFDTHAQ